MSTQYEHKNMEASSENDEEFQKKRYEINKMLEGELNRLNKDKVKDKAKEYNIIFPPKIKKQELNDIIYSEFDKCWDVIISKKIPELKNICKMNKIVGTSGLKKSCLCLLIMSHCAINCILNPDVEKTKQAENSLEELEKQKQEIEKKMIEEIERQKQQQMDIERQKQQQTDIEIQKQQQTDIEIQKQQQTDIEIQKQQQEETERQKQQQEEKAELKRKKHSIPKKVKDDVWNTYIGVDINRHRCLCCKKTVISNRDFHVGHVLSEIKGGTQEINNLRPICPSCNHSMGAENMVDYVKKYGYYIG